MSTIIIRVIIYFGVPYSGLLLQVQIFKTLKSPPAEISTIAKSVRQENSRQSFIHLKYKNFSLPLENFCEASLYLQISEKFGPRRKNPLYDIVST